MTRLQAAIGGIIVPAALILSIAVFAPEMLGKPEAVTTAAAEPPPEALLAPAGEVDRTAVTPVIFKKPPEVALVAVAALPAAPAPAASPCERYLRPVSVPAPDGVLDRLLDDRAERVVAEQKKQSRRARDCYRAERGGDGR